MMYAGLIGSPVTHSLSPRMHNAAFTTRSIEARYELWETSPGELDARVQMLRAPWIFGANVTIPYKEIILPLLDECDPLSTRIGAVNTIVQRGGRLCGYNTDAPGFLRALHEHIGPSFDLRSRRVIVLGTGGAARGAALALLDSQVAALTILGRDPKHLDQLLAHLVQYKRTAELSGAILGTGGAEGYLARGDIVINTTSVGLRPGDETRLIDVEILPASSLVMDMIFNPPHTLLLKEAQAHGCSILNGLSMLLYQGVLAWELWTGQSAPEDAMRTALGLQERRKEKC